MIRMGMTACTLSFSLWIEDDAYFWETIKTGDKRDDGLLVSLVFSCSFFFEIHHSIRSCFSLCVLLHALLYWQCNLELAWRACACSGCCRGGGCDGDRAGLLLDTGDHWAILIFMCAFLSVQFSSISRIVHESLFVLCVFFFISSEHVCISVYESELLFPGNLATFNLPLGGFCWAGNLACAAGAFVWWRPHLSVSQYIFMDKLGEFLSILRASKGLDCFIQ